MRHLKTYENVMIDSSGSMGMHDHLEDKEDFVYQTENFYVLYTYPFYYVYEIKTKNGVCTCTSEGKVINKTGTPYTQEVNDELDGIIEKIPMLKDVNKYNL